MTVAGFPVVLLFGGLTLGLLALAMIDRAERRPLFVVGGLLIADGLVTVLQGTIASVATGGAGEGNVLDSQIYLGRAGTALMYLVVALGLLRPRRVEGGRTLAMAALCVGVATYISLVLHSGVLVQESPIRWMLRVLAVYVAWSLQPADIARFVKVLLGIILVGSLVGGLAGVPWMWRQFEGATQLLPGVSLRFQGLAAHPNGLAPLALLYLVADRVAPEPGWWRRPLQAVAITCLLLTQSKTALLTGVGVFALFLYHDRIRPDEQSRRALPLVLVGATLMAAVLFFGVTDGPETDVLGEDDALTGTLTGRTQLWQVGIDAWRQSPISGAGSDFFTNYAARTQQPWAGQAHNQYVETVTRFGLVGLTGLLLYVAVLVVYAWRLRDHTRQVSMALVGLLLLRSITETPIDTLDLVHVPVLAMLLGWSREVAADATDPPQPVAARGSAGGGEAGQRMP